MQLTEKQTNIRILVPSKNKRIKHIKSGTVYESKIYLGKEDSLENYEETDELALSPRTKELDEKDFLKNYNKKKETDN